MASLTRINAYCFILLTIYEAIFLISSLTSKWTNLHYWILILLIIKVTLPFLNTNNANTAILFFITINCAWICLAYNYQPNNIIFFEFISFVLLNSIFIPVLMQYIVL